jgi:pyridinium-3,5-biscarboxylic acid mononucleotide synthase
MQPSAYEVRLRELLERVAGGDVPAAEAAHELRDLPFSDLGFAKVDHHRELRQGACEIVYAAGKTPEELRAIVRRLLAGNEGSILVTRASAEHVAAVREAARDGDAEVVERPRAGCVGLLRGVRRSPGRVLILTAGTSDLPVAEEAQLAADVLGVDAEIVADVGVAGMHRLSAARSQLAAADAVVVIAGMEGALASVVAGLAPCPVIACPTSVGYGASFGGLAALLSMLSSCAPGVVCVNVDDGVGAGYTAALIAAHGG